MPLVIILMKKMLPTIPSGPGIGFTTSPCRLRLPNDDDHDDDDDDDDHNTNDVPLASLPIISKPFGKNDTVPPTH